jgi:hypothetical protein
MGKKAIFERKFYTVKVDGGHILKVDTHEEQIPLWDFLDDISELRSRTKPYEMVVYLTADHNYCVFAPYNDKTFIKVPVYYDTEEDVIYVSSERIEEIVDFLNKYPQHGVAQIYTEYTTPYLVIDASTDADLKTLLKDTFTDKEE